MRIQLRTDDTQITSRANRRAEWRRFVRPRSESQSCLRRAWRRLRDEAVSQKTVARLLPVPSVYWENEHWACLSYHPLEPKSCLPDRRPTACLWRRGRVCSTVSIRETWGNNQTLKSGKTFNATVKNGHILLPFIVLEAIFHCILWKWKDWRRKIFCEYSNSNEIASDKAN